MKNSIKISFITLLLLFHSSTMIDGNQRSTESTIRTELFHNHGYERRSRSTFSALNYGSTFQSLSLILKLIYIHDYSQDTNVLKTIGLLELTWIDELLRWNKSNYDNIDQIRIRLNEVYHPDIMLQNSVDNRNLLDKGEDWHNSDLFLYSTGMVYCLPLITMETICEPIDDEQEIINCPFMFVSWMIDINHFNLTSTDLLQTNSKVKQYLLESNPPFLIINYSIELRIDPLLDNPQLIYHFRLRRLTNLNVKSSIMLVVDCIIIINCFSIFLLRLEKKSRSIIQNLTMISLVIILVYLGIVNNAHKIGKFTKFQRFHSIFFIPHFSYLCQQDYRLGFSYNSMVIKYRKWTINKIDFKLP